jgi:hypothetical protein
MYTSVPTTFAAAPSIRETFRMTKRTTFATAAAVFAVSTFAAAAHADVVCAGGNACKGQSACKSTNNACKGQNACKGKGFIMAGSTFECTVIKETR